MQVEEFCQFILADSMRSIDPGKTGLAFDVGVGTFSFYCEQFARQGFRTVAVEPMPIDTVRTLCTKHGITLIESAISDHDGTADLYIGNFDGQENFNLNSLQADWWSSSSATRTVSTVTLSTLWSQADTRKVTCLKVDTEGSESVILSQIPDLEPTSLPEIIMFEYGGGSDFASGSKAWTPVNLEKILTCLRVLKQCGYRHSVVIDSHAPLRFVDLSEIPIAAAAFFAPESHYGNIIAYRSFVPDSPALHRASRLYQPTPARLLMRIVRRVRKAFS